MAHTARLSTRSAKQGVCAGVFVDVLVDVLVDALMGVMTGVSAGVLVVCIHKPPLCFSNGNSKKHEYANHKVDTIAPYNVLSANKRSYINAPLREHTCTKHKHAANACKRK